MVAYITDFNDISIIVLLVNPYGCTGAISNLINVMKCYEENNNPTYHMLKYTKGFIGVQANRLTMLTRKP